MKVKAVIIMIILFVAVFSGCAKKSENNNSATDPTAAATTPTVSPTTAATTAPTTAAATTTAPTTAPTDTKPDAVSSASIVDTNEAFLNAISKSGTWIIAITKDLSFPDQELLLEGQFKNGKKDEAGNEQIQRKIALYSQDENRNITARYTLTADKLIIGSPMASIQHGTFKGDVYVMVNDFQLVDATVEGNVYFTSQEAKDSFKMDETSKITGKQEVQ